MFLHRYCVLKWCSLQYNGCEIYSTVESDEPIYECQQLILLENQNLSFKFKDNCTHPAILDFPTLFIPGGKLGAVIIPALITIYLYLLLTAVCEDYFVPSINIICSKLGLKGDIAGPTLLAASSSSPEFFINVISTFITKGDIGVGTIVGSALFNILAIPALCGLFAYKVVKLDPWPLIRDSFFYGLAIIVLVVSLLDGKVRSYEAFTFILLYFVYITAMYWNKYLQQYFELICLRTQQNEEESLIIISEIDETDRSPMELKGKTDEENQGSQRILSWPYKGTTIENACYIITLPITVTLAYTIPDCRLVQKKHLYIISFGLCIIWIGITTYIIAWMITIAGTTLNIPDCIMGLTFVAVGMSLPEVAVSIIIARQGDMSMALSNSIGSNIFDILLCLGLPWFIKSTFFSTTGAYYVLINSKGIGHSSFFLFLVLIISLLIFFINKFELDRKVGYIFLVMYILFVTISVILETNCFLFRILSMCPISRL